MKKLIVLLLCALMICGMSGMAVFAQEPEGEQAIGPMPTEIAEADVQTSEEDRIAAQILEGMTMDEKIAQMIIPAIRTWNEEPVTDLSAVPELADALKKHPYGGIILYGSNVTGIKQVTELIAALQANNAAIEGVSTHIPYFMPVDQEGGIVVRLTSGTRMTGSMAIGATGEHAQDNARATGYIIGEELAAAGFNIDFAPDIDVNNNAANPVIGTRSFSDDAQMVSDLGIAYGEGLAQNHIIATYKHFPGHGDTGVDSHIGTPSVDKTYEQLKKVELVPFEYAISSGAEMIMTAHITFPQIDEEVTFGDGVTKGYYPATMSRRMITEILRGDLKFEGVVVADALEMDAIRSAGLVPGEQDSVEYQVNIAEKVINAGVDIILLPLDMTNADAVSFYDDYIAGLEAKVAEGVIAEEQIDAAVLRILKLKEKYGILDMYVTNADTDAAVERAVQVIGSEEHHKVEMEIARQAITMVRNDEETLPVEGTGRNIVAVGRNADDSKTIAYAIGLLQKSGKVDPDAQIVNLVSGDTTGNDDAETKITIDYYFDPGGENSMLHYTEDLKAAIAEADTVICLSKTSSLDAMASSNDQYRGISIVIEDAHTAGARAVLLSDNLPYDSARYQEADAIVLAYMGSGLDMDPTEKNGVLQHMNAYNANVVAAIQIIFGEGTPTGILPVNIPAIAVQEDGTLAYTEEILYERGFGLTY